MQDQKTKDQLIITGKIDSIGSTLFTSINQISDIHCAVNRIHSQSASTGIAKEEALKPEPYTVNEKLDCLSELAASIYIQVTEIRERLNVLV